MRGCALRYLIFVIETTERPPHSPSEIAAIDAFNEKLEAAGQRLLAVGIDSPAKSLVIDNRGGAAIASSGPLIENHEFISGIWIINVASHEEAVQLAHEGSQACNRKVELRPLLGN